MRRLEYAGFQHGNDELPGFGLFTVVDPSHRAYRSTFSHVSIVEMGFTLGEVLEALDYAGVDLKEDSNGRD